MQNKETIEVIVLGGGCFWCTEAIFKEVMGVLDVESGYSNGHISAPSYKQVCTGETGHNEVVKITFDSSQVSVRDLLEVFFSIHDPSTLNRQGVDVGTQYRSGVYFTTPLQQAEALKIIEEINKSNKLVNKVVTEVLPLQNYWAAEELHQDFFENNPTQGYCVATISPKLDKFTGAFAHLRRKA